MPVTRRRFNQYLLGTCAATLAFPALADLREGRDWQPVLPPMPSDTPGKIEVLLFFSYGCPHCKQFDPIVTEWSRHLPKDVAFRRVPVTFGRQAWVNLARLYYTIQATGDAQRLDEEVFRAIHEQHKRIFTEKGIMNWLGKQGVDVGKAGDIYNSFDVQTEVGRSDYLVERYKIDAVPRLVVGGRYVVVAEEAKSFQELLAIADGLILKARAAENAAS